MPYEHVYVHVCQPAIKYNAVHGTSLPVLTVKRKGQPLMLCHEVEGQGKCVSAAVRNETQQLDADGARVWMEYDASTFIVVGEEWHIDYALRVAMELHDKELLGAFATIKANWLSSLSKEEISSIVNPSGELTISR